jgi:hypothetical protein
MPITPMLGNKIIGSSSILSWRSKANSESSPGHQGVKRDDSLPRRKIEKDIQFLGTNPSDRLKWPRDVHNNSMIHAPQQLSRREILFHADMDYLSIWKSLSHIFNCGGKQDGIA